MEDDYDSTQPYYGLFDNGYSDLDSKPSTYSDSDAYKYTCSDTECEKDAAAGNWNGNWLNWLAMTQFDLMEKVVVGGQISPAPDSSNISGNLQVRSQLADLPNK